MNELLEIKDLVTNFYTYEGVVKALNKISLVIPHGCTFGLVGESGCGKSVTVRSIMRIVQPPGRIEGGEILLFMDDDKQQLKAIDLLKQSEAYMQQLRGNHISMIFQEPNAALNPIMSIGEQVVESYLLHQYDALYMEAFDVGAKDVKSGRFRPWRQGPVKKAAEKRAIALLAQLGITNPEAVIKHYPHNLSGGMKQRIAMALACYPVLLIADEATSNLDVTIQAQILELLCQLKKERISSILLITHDLGVVAETCDRVGVMYAGNLCEEADVLDLFNHPLHPYSQALLASVPKVSQTGALQSIDGAVPNLVNPPTGCRFHPRCPFAMDICKAAFPEMKEITPGHTVACYLYV